MNLDALFDDLEARFERLQQPAAELAGLTVAGLDFVTFAKDHYSGIDTATGHVRIIVYRHSPAAQTIPGESKLSQLKLNQALANLVGLWVNLETTEKNISGRILAVDQGLVLFHEMLVPIATIKSIELRAVENPKRIFE